LFINAQYFAFAHKDNIYFDILFGKMLQALFDCLSEKAAAVQIAGNFGLVKNTGNHFFGLKKRGVLSRAFVFLIF